MESGELERLLARLLAGRLVGDREREHLQWLLAEARADCLGVCLDGGLDPADLSWDWRAVLSEFGLLVESRPLASV